MIWQQYCIRKLNYQIWIIIMCQIKCYWKVVWRYYSISFINLINFNHLKIRRSLHFYKESWSNTINRIIIECICLNLESIISFSYTGILNIENCYYNGLILSYILVYKNLIFCRVICCQICIWTWCNLILNGA